MCVPSWTVGTWTAAGTPIESQAHLEAGLFVPACQGVRSRAGLIPRRDNLAAIDPGDRVQQRRGSLRLTPAGTNGGWSDALGVLPAESTQW